MADELSAWPDYQAIHQGLADLRQTWEHLARELASGVPELPSVIEQELAGLTLPDLNEETLIRVTDGVVARVAAAGFPDEAAALFRRMGRAMYELLLLLATQEEIRELGASAPPVPPAPRAEAAPLSAAPRPRAEVLSPPPWIPDMAPAAREVLAPPQVTAPPIAKEPGASTDGTAPQPSETPSTFEPRDPVRPARATNGRVPVLPLKPGAAEALPPAAPDVPASRPSPAPRATVEAPAPRSAAKAAPTSSEQLPLSAAVEEPTPPIPVPQSVPSPPPLAAQSPPPARPSVPSPPQFAAQSPLPVPQSVPSPPALAGQLPPPARPSVHSSLPLAAQSPPPAPPSTPALTEARRQAPVQNQKELTEDEAPLWGFDPATRETEAGEESAPSPAGSPAPEVPAAVAAALAGGGPQAVTAAHWPDHAPHSGWTVRLSPRTSTEQERKLQARQAQLPLLVEEIVATAKSQQAGLSSRGNARRVLAAARGKLPLADGADPSSLIQSLLDTGQLEEAATMAVQMADVLPGEEAAGVACAVGEGVKQAKHFELAVLCFTTAVLCCPPCDRACWQMCTLSIERRDIAMAPVWVEFVARLLRAKGADGDAISVYRHLLKLTPRRPDIRELLSISSLTGTLPD